MSFFDQIASFLSVQIETPTSFGWFHLMFVGLMIVGTIILCITAKTAVIKNLELLPLWLGL